MPPRVTMPIPDRAEIEAGSHGRWSGSTANSELGRGREMPEYDAIIVGAGAGGGIAAYVLTMAGRRVLLLERGGWIDLKSTGRDHLRNQRISLYGHNAGPDVEGNPRVYVDPTGAATTVRP